MELKCNCWKNTFHHNRNTKPGSYACLLTKNAPSWSWQNFFGLTHWGLVMHTQWGKLTLIQDIACLFSSKPSAVDFLPIRPPATHFRFEIQNPSFKKIHSNISSSQHRPYCSGLIVLNHLYSCYTQQHSALQLSSPVEECISHKRIITHNGGKPALAITHHCLQQSCLYVGQMCLDSFGDFLTVSLHNPNGRHLPAIRAVQGDC